MISSGHCMMNQDFVDDFAKFYDYSKENLELIQKYALNT